MEDNLNKLYDYYTTLSNAKNVSEQSEEYSKAIEGSKGNDLEKKFTCQLLPKFFKHFPDLQEQAIDALLDLCEDDNSSVRICAIKALPLLCKDLKEHVVKVTDILAQLLQLEEPDLGHVRNSLSEVFKQHPVNVTMAIFHHIETIHEPAVKEKCISIIFKFLMKNLEKPIPELDDILIEESKKILEDASCKEFISVMDYLKTTKFSKTKQQELLDIIADQAELDHDFDPLEEGSNNIDRIITCIEYALPLFSSTYESSKFVMYICDQVLPQWSNIEKVEKGEIKQLLLLRLLARLSVYCGNLDNPSLHVVQIFDKIKSYMPLPPENVDITNLPNLDFTSVECLLFAFHRLARQCPDLLTHDPIVLKDFQTRLMYFSRILQSSHKALTQKLSASSKLTPKELEDSKIGSKLLSNINALIKDLFYKPPVYKCSVTLSFLDENKKATKRPSETSVTTTKRHAPITFDSSNGSTNKHVRSNKPGENLKLYQPPSGKFSNNFQNYDRPGRNRGRGRNLRGRGSGGRNWRN